MGITISGENNNDRILASDGVIDQLSGFNITGVVTATTFTGNLTGDVTGNLTGNVNHTSNLLLQIGGSEKFRVGTSGQLGIGGANYGTSGQVITSGGSGSAVFWSTVDLGAVTGATGDFSIADKIVHTGDTNTALRFPEADTITAETGGSERFRISSAGVIQCGTSGVLKAEINNAVSGHQFISQCDDDNNGFEVYQKHGSTTSRNTLAVYANTGAGSAKELQFAVRGDGNVGIGTETPSGVFHTHAATGVNRNYIEASASNAFLRLKAGSTSNNSGVEFFSGSSNIANITGIGTGGLQFEVGGSERVRILSSGGITFNGDYTTANALDDYEEGTWTPDVRFSNHLGEANQLSYHSRTGYYTKSGNTVTISGFFNVSSLNSKTGNFYMFGLPHAPLSNTNPVITIVGDGFDFGSNEFGTTFLLIEGGNNRSVGGWQRETGWSYITNSNITSGGMYLTGLYYV